MTDFDNELRITLPNRETMTRNLIEVRDEPHSIERFYPLICNQLAGRELVGMGVVNGLVLAIHDYCQGMPQVMMNIQFMIMPQLIAAVTPEGKVRDEALKHWEEVLKMR